MKGRSSRCVGWCAHIALAVALTACGTQSGSGTGEEVGSAIVTSDATVGSTSPSPPVSSSEDSVPPTDGSPVDSGDVSKWSEIDLGRAIGDDYVPLAEFGGEVWAARLTEQRDSFEVRQLHGGDVQRFDAPPGSRPPQLFGTPFGLVLLTSDYGSFVTTVRVSTDAAVTWTESQISSRPFDVAGVTVVDGALLASGVFRSEAEPGTGPFTPGVFRSTDGVTWTEVPIDPTVFDMGDSYLGPIIDLGDRLVVSGALDSGDFRMPAMFESFDQGSTWGVAPDSGPVPTAVVAAGRTLVGVSAYQSPLEPTTPVSTNSDGEWRPVELSRLARPFQYATTFPLSGGPSALISLNVEPTTEYCYENIDECQTGLTPVMLLVSEDGTVVSVDLGMTSISWPTSALVESDGSLHVVTARDERLVLRTWDASNGPVPTMPDVEPFTPSGPPLVEWGSALDVGVTYRFALGTHCGIDVLGEFNGEPWWIVGSPEPAYDQHQFDMSQRLLGEITLVDPGTIEYRVDGELIATYAPSAEEPPGCD